MQYMLVNAGNQKKRVKTLSHAQSMHKNETIYGWIECGMWGKTDENVILSENVVTWKNIEKQHVRLSWRAALLNFSVLFFLHT